MNNLQRLVKCPDTQAVTTFSASKPTRTVNPPPRKYCWWTTLNKQLSVPIVRNCIIFTKVHKS